MVEESKSNSPNDDLLDIYDEMRNRQRNAIFNQKMRYDAFFDSNKGREYGETFGDSATYGVSRLDDTRRCLAISCIMDESAECEWTDAYHSLQQRLRDEFDDSKHLRFGQSATVGNINADKNNDSSVVAGQLHWTLMQLVGFPDYDAEVLHASNAGYYTCSTSAEEEKKQEGCYCGSSVFTTNEYLDCVQRSLMEDGGMNTAVTIKYIGCIAVSTGLLMVGVPVDEFNINGARDTLREKLKRSGMPLKEPFVNDIVHSTLFRTCSTPMDSNNEDHLRILDIAKDYENVDLGTVTLRKFQIGPASWRMLQSEMKDTPPLRKWTLPSMK